MTKLKKEVYVIQVQFKNHNNEDVREFKEEFEQYYNTRFIGYDKENLVEFSDAKVYQSYEAASKAMRQIDIRELNPSENIADWENCDDLKVTIRTFTLSI